MVRATTESSNFLAWPPPTLPPPAPAASALPASRTASRTSWESAPVVSGAWATSEAATRRATSPSKSAFSRRTAYVEREGERIQSRT